MPLNYNEGQHVTGVVNTTTYGDTIVSSEEEMKSLTDITVSVSAHDDSAYFVGKIDRDEFLRIPADLLPVFDDSGGTNTFQTAMQRATFLIDYDLEIGEKLKFGIECAGTAIDAAYTLGFTLR